MRLRNLTFSSPEPIERVTLSVGPPVAADAQTMVPAVDTEITSDRDLAIFLLHVAGEVEHALLVQYLYAVFTAPATAPATWITDIRTIAIQEMGHLITVQNVLIALRATVTLEREDYPFRRGYYPFEFGLDPFSLKTLARYTLAEMPHNGHGLTPQELADLQLDAGVAGGVTSVGALYAQLIDVIARLDPIEFLGDPDFQFQAAPAEWHGSDADNPDATIVRRIKTRDDAVKALTAIAVQGEGDGINAGSHFLKFLKIYRAFKAAPIPLTAAASNPNTSGQPPAGEITATRTRQWAHLFNLQYRLLLHGLWLSLHTKPKAPTDTDDFRKLVVNQIAFRHMHLIARLAPVLTSLPLKNDGSATLAGPPFELPYQIPLGTDELGNWLTLRDVLASSSTLAKSLQDSETDPTRKTLLSQFIKDPASDPWKTIDARIGTLRPAPDLLEIRLLPAMALARFGSSADPMDNYDVVTPPGTGPRTLVPAETLTIDPVTGAIKSAITPASVRFRDAAGKIRPVSPFIELWGRFTTDGPFEPLTMNHLQALKLTPADVHWHVDAGNLKAARRTNSAADRITAAIDLNKHAPVALNGTCANFKPGKSIPFGKVHYTLPTPAFPEIRLRFTPAAGKVYGPATGDPNVVDDVYDSSRGGWANFADPNNDRSTVPGSIYAGTFNSQTNAFVSKGYLDDSCDGIVSVSIQLPNGKKLTTVARIAAGPPTFAPASVPVRTIGDELVQVLEGPEATTGTKEEVAATLHRALDTVRLMQTSVMNGNQAIGGVSQNTNNMAGQDQGSYGRAMEPIFPPVGVEQAQVVARHEGMLNQVLAGGPVAVSPRVRAYDKVGDLTNAGRQKMPAMMRGADGKHLALTRRQLSVIKRYEESVPPPPLPPPETPRDTMLKLIAHLRDNEGAAGFHGAVPAGPGKTVQTLFATPPDLLDFLVTGKTQLGSVGVPAGQPLVVKGNPAASAFVAIVKGTSFMATKFQTPIATLGNRTGVEIVVAWISSLT